MSKNTNKERRAKVANKLKRAMTVAELKDLLENYDEEAVVVFVCDYGDHSHTQQALLIESAEELNSSDFHESAYSNSGIAQNRSNDDFDKEVEEDVDEEDEIQVVVLV